MQEWYLMTPETRPNITGGFENESHVNYKKDAFDESLQTDIATTVTLFKSDLTDGKSVRCIIQGNIADTQLKSLERIGLFQIGTVLAGMYIYYEDRYWLITGYPGNNGIYEKVTLSLCQFKIKWQNDNGKVIERWCNGTSASKYDTGRTGNQYVILTSNNFTVLLPDDDDSASLDGKRVFIDRNINNPRKVFKITRSDDILYLFGETHGGILSFIADKNEFDPNCDRPDLGICNYIDPNIFKNPELPKDNSSIDNISATITGNTNLKIGISRTYTVSFMNGNSKIEGSSINFKWYIKSKFPIEQKVSGEYNENITLKVSDEDYIDDIFELQIIVNESILSKKEITIVDVI